MLYMRRRMLRRRLVGGNMNLLKYNLFHIPYDLISWMHTESGKNWCALAVSTIIFWGGTIAVLCTTNAVINKSNGGVYVMLGCWAVFCIINVVTIVEYPGLFYCDPIHTSRLFRIWQVILGPIGTLRAAALWFFLDVRIRDRFRTASMLAATPVSKWPEENSWQRTIKGQLEIPTTSHWSKCKRALKSLWEIANKRIEII